MLASHRHGKLPVLAQIAGVTPAALVAELRDARNARECRHEMFRCRRNKAFAAIHLLEHEQAAEVDPQKRASQEKSLGRTRLRMRTAMQRMSRVGLAPTDLEIATVLCVPKGTGDSGLYWLKRKLASAYDTPNLGAAS